MAINVNTVYQDVKYLINKEQGTGYLQPATFNAFAAQASREIFEEMFSQYQKTTAVTDSLLDFIKKSNLAIDDTGLMAYPSDYVHFIAVRAYDPVSLAAATAVCDDENPVDYSKIPQLNVKIIDNDKLGGRLMSKVVAPTKERPIATFYNDGLKFYPIDLGVAIFEYLRLPVNAVWGYTTDAYGLEVYDSATSTNFEWSEQVQNTLVARICKYFGVEVREQDLIQAANMIQQQQK